MSGECDKCGEHALECRCKPLCQSQQNGIRIFIDMITSEDKCGVEIYYSSVDLTTSLVFNDGERKISIDCNKKQIDRLILLLSLLPDT